MNLEPINVNDALNYGNLGHSVLEVFYRCLMEGATKEDAIIEARKVFMQALDMYGMEIIAVIDPLLQMYWAWIDVDEWEILAVEEMFDLPITEDFSMPSRLDLVVRRRRDGKMGIVDHKFKYDFMTPVEIAMNAQQVKYRFLMTKLGHPVEFAILNQLRYRKLKEPTPDKLFRRVEVPYNTRRVRSMLRQQIVASQEIVKYRAQSEEKRKELATPVLNPMICKNCFFNGLCSSELDGGDIEYLIANEYRPKESYGYNNENEKVMEKL